MYMYFKNYEKNNVRYNYDKVANYIPCEKFYMLTWIFNITSYYTF